MALITGNTIAKRKRALAEIVVRHLSGLGHHAELVEGRTNSSGHRDTVVVESSIGFVHVAASGSTAPNDTIRAAGYSDGDQTFLAEKSYVAFGWNTKDGRTMVMFVPASDIAGKASLPKSEIKRLSIPALSAVLVSA